MADFNIKKENIVHEKQMIELSNDLCCGVTYSSSIRLGASGRGMSHHLTTQAKLTGNKEGFIVTKWYAGRSATGEKKFKKANEIVLPVDCDGDFDYPFVSGKIHDPLQSNK